MAYIILSAAGFGISRRDAELFNHFITFTFRLLVRIIFVKKTLLTTTSVFYSGIKNVWSK